ncbi:SMP-30/gluconolactonase/LRE family protein [candidate division KSB1 bacterium]|nr:SMP-30/gluconolactonase/LRE family protein [candidate division KSB1 bacterium]
MIKKAALLCFILIAAIVLILNQSQIFSQSILDPNARLEEIASGILQPEGPVWKNGIGLLFSDIKGNKIYKWTSEKGKEVYLSPSDSTNGLTYDLKGNLIAGQMGLRRIVRFENDGTQTSLADRYDGKRFSSPNDLVVKSDGSIFFTDPDFNIPIGQKKELGFNGIYRISPKGVLQLLTTLALPNGICFSPDEKKLYVNDSQAHKIYVWDVINDSTIANKKLFFTIPVTGYADGMKIDGAGNIYCTCSSAVWVISPSEEQLGKINLPSNTSASNCAWGEADNKTLFITAGTSVYKIRPLVSAIEKHGSIIPEQFKLFQNYPNPFNPSTMIAFNLPAPEIISLKVYNITGEEIETLIQGEVPAGQHEIYWSASNQASGFYIYSLQSDKFHESKKMIFQK